MQLALAVALDVSKAEATSYFLAWLVIAGTFTACWCLTHTKQKQSTPLSQPPELRSYSLFNNHRSGLGVPKIGRSPPVSFGDRHASTVPLGPCQVIPKREVAALTS